MQNVQPLASADRSPLIPTTAAARHGKQLRPVCRNNGCYDPDSLRPGHALDHHPLRSSILADGELTAREAERVVWDVIVVGTGMGGGMLGYSLARSGRRRAVRRKGALDTARNTRNHSRCHSRTGRAAFGPFRRGATTTPWPGPDAPPTKSKTSAGASRSGSCRSSAAAPAGPRPCTAWSANDSSCAISLPGKTSPTPAIPPCPRPGRSAMTRWCPGTPRPKSCSGVRGQPDPLRPEAAEVGLPAGAAVFGSTTRRWSTIW